MIWKGKPSCEERCKTDTLDTETLGGAVEKIPEKEFIVKILLPDYRQMV